MIYPDLIRLNGDSAINLPLASVYPITLLILVAGTISRFSITIKLDLVFAILSLIFCQIVLLKIMSYSEEIGIYSYIFAVIIVIVLLKPPTEEELLLAAKIFMSAVFFLVIVSLVLAMLAPDFATSTNPIRHPWAKIGSISIWRVNGLFRGPGVFGLMGSLLMCYAIVFRGKIVASYSLVGAVALLMSDSRSALLATFISSLIIFVGTLTLEDWSGNWSRRYMSLITFAFSGTYFASLGVGGFMAGSSHRFEIWQEAATAPLRDAPANFSHAHNFVLEALNAPEPIIRALLLLAAILIVLIAISCVKRRNLVPIIFLVPILIYSSFEGGIHWNRLNIPTMALLFGLFSSRFNLLAPVRRTDANVLDSERERS